MLNQLKKDYKQQWFWMIVNLSIGLLMVIVFSSVLGYLNIILSFIMCFIIAKIKNAIDILEGK